MANNGKQNGKQLDTTVEIVTPENIAFRYRVAGPFRRLPAYLIDLAIRIFVVVAAGLGALVVFGSIGMGAVAVGAWLAFWFCLEWFYGGLFETFWNGQTPGKHLLGLRVVSTDGQPICGWQAILRNVLRVVDAQPFYFYQLGFWAALMNSRFQRLGDLACRTMVVVEERHGLRDVMRTGEPDAARLANLIPRNHHVSRTLGLALAAYVQRRRAFSWGRRQEIARHLGEPMRRRFDLPANTDLDMLLCGLYHRTFLADQDEEPARGGSPFMTPVAPRRDIPEVLSFLDPMK
jgi:uncharacterized RDD family membrane protein YckC